MSKPTLRYRLFGAGKMPPDLVAAASGPTLLAVEGVSVVQGGSYRAPGIRASGSVTLRTGAIVCTSGSRMLLSVGKRILVDTDVTQPGPGGGVRVELLESGPVVTVDVGRIADGEGQVTFTYSQPLDLPALSVIPRAFAARGRMDDVYKLLRIRPPRTGGPAPVAAG